MRHVGPFRKQSLNRMTPRAGDQNLMATVTLRFVTVTALT
jgi:hypothetical protein